MNGQNAKQSGLYKLLQREVLQSNPDYGVQSNVMCSYLYYTRFDISFLPSRD